MSGTWLTCRRQVRASRMERLAVMLKPERSGATTAFATGDSHAQRPRGAMAVRLSTCAYENVIAECERPGESPRVPSNRTDD